MTTISGSPVSGGSLVTLAEFKAYYGITDASNDTLYQSYIDQATAIISQKTGLVFTSAELTEFYQGTGTKQLVLRRRPVTAVASVYVDDSAYFGFASGAFGSSTLLTAGEDFALDIQTSGLSKSGILYRINGSWPGSQDRLRTELVGGEVPGAGNVKVTYTAGYAIPPADLKLAGLLLSRLIMISSAYGGQMLQSESLEYYSYQLRGQTDSQGRQLSADLHSVNSIVAAYREVKW